MGRIRIRILPFLGADNADFEKNFENFNFLKEKWGLPLALIRKTRIIIQIDEEIKTMAEKKIQSSFMIEPSLKARAERLSEEQGISYGELIRKAILDYVGGDLTTEDEIREIKKQIADIEKRLARLDDLEKRLAELEGDQEWEQ